MDWNDALEDRGTRVPETTVGVWDVARFLIMGILLGWSITLFRRVTPQATHQLQVIIAAVFLLTSALLLSETIRSRITSELDRAIPRWVIAGFLVASVIFAELVA
jgi:hypothetical protein